MEKINHPAHYGGDTVYETIKVIEAWDLGFNLGNTLKYISRCGKKDDEVQDLEKAAFYLNREIQRRKPKPTEAPSPFTPEQEQRIKAALTCRSCGREAVGPRHSCPGPFTQKPQDPWERAKNLGKLEDIA